MCKTYFGNRPFSAVTHWLWFLTADVQWHVCNGSRFKINNIYKQRRYGCFPQWSVFVLTYRSFTGSSVSCSMERIPGIGYIINECWSFLKYILDLPYSVWRHTHFETISDGRCWRTYYCDLALSTIEGSRVKFMVVSITARKESSRVQLPD